MAILVPRQQHSPCADRAVVNAKLRRCAHRPQHLSVDVLRFLLGVPRESLVRVALENRKKKKKRIILQSSTMLSVCVVASHKRGVPPRRRDKNIMV